MTEEKDQEQGVWFLEGYLDNPKMMKRWMVRPLPYRVGRHPDMELSLPFKSVSSRHAELYIESKKLRVRDLKSLNGTFVNRTRIQGETLLQEGDILHFAECEFRVGRLQAETADPSKTVYTDLSGTDLPGQMATGVREFKQMLLSHAVAPIFQPIVEIDGTRCIGYEILGRGDQEGLSSAPLELFRIASSLGLEAELSALFRLRGIEAARQFKGAPQIFVNTHPSEMESEKLLPSLKTIRHQDPRLAIVVEIHEAAVTDLREMRELRKQLADLGMGLAYDDFGAGQARLLELVEVPPDYLKFDVSLIRKLDKAPVSRQKMVESLVKIARDIEVPCLAEGVEAKEERALCQELGFQFAQGYFFGKPAPLSTWLG